MLDTVARLVSERHRCPCSLYAGVSCEVICASVGSGEVASANLSQLFVCVDATYKSVDCQVACCKLVLLWRAIFSALWGAT